MAANLSPDVHIRVGASPKKHLQLRFRKADIIHSTIPFPPSYAGVATIHGDFRSENHLYRLGYERLVRKSTIVTTPSNFMREKLGLQRAEVIPNAVNPAEKRPDPKNDHDVFLVASKFAFLDKTEGTVSLLRDLDKLLRGREVRIEVAGGGRFASLVERQVSQMNVPTVFHGWHRNIRALFERANVLVYRSPHDNQPLILLEAMMSGMPVLSNSVGGVPEFLDAHQRYDSPQEFAERLERTFDSGWRRAVGSRNHDYAAATFGWPVVRRQWLTVYSRLFERKR